MERVCRIDGRMWLEEGEEGVGGAAGMKNEGMVAIDEIIAT